MAFYYNWKLTLVVLAFSPFLLLGGMVRGRRYKSFAAEEGKKLVDASAVE